MGSRRIRLANLPPGLSGSAIPTSLARYGDIQSIPEENRSKNYSYAVSNAIRIVTMTLNKHLPSHVTIAGFRALISCEGQPQTYYGCGETDHMFQACPKRRGVKPLVIAATGPSWTQLSAPGLSLSDTSEYVKIAQWQQFPDIDQCYNHIPPVRAPALMRADPHLRQKRQVSTKCQQVENITVPWMSKVWVMPSNTTKYDVIYLYLLTTIVSAYIWPSSGQNINLESKYV
jgi:hypothetical protein